MVLYQIHIKILTVIDVSDGAFWMASFSPDEGSDITISDKVLNSEDGADHLETKELALNYHQDMPCRA